MAKLSAVDSRIMNFTNAVKKAEDVSFCIEWKDSKTWGTIPRVIYENEKICSVSGSGFEKESALLGELLKFLCPKAQSFGGAGFALVAKAVGEYGYELTNTYSSKRFDAYRVRKI
jgi:hypothetical protein